MTMHRALNLRFYVSRKEGENELYNTEVCVDESIQVIEKYIQVKTAKKIQLQ